MILTFRCSAANDNTKTTLNSSSSSNTSRAYLNKQDHTCVVCGVGGCDGGNVDGKYVFCEFIVACYLQRSSFIAAVFVRKLFCLRLDNESESTSAAYM